MLPVCDRPPSGSSSSPAMAPGRIDMSIGSSRRSSRSMVILDPGSGAWSVGCMMIPSRKLPGGNAPRRGHSLASTSYLKAVFRPLVPGLLSRAPVRAPVAIAAGSICQVSGNTRRLARKNQISRLSCLNRELAMPVGDHAVWLVRLGRPVQLGAVAGEVLVRRGARPHRHSLRR